MIELQDSTHELRLLHARFKERVSAAIKARNKNSKRYKQHYMQFKSRLGALALARGDTYAAKTFHKSRYQAHYWKKKDIHIFYKIEADYLSAN